MSIIDTLITGRTGPGKYDWQDFNRVGEAVAYVAQRLEAAGYTADVVTKTDWTRQSIQTRQDMERYIANIQALRNILAFPPGVPDAPNTIRFLTFRKANDIETIVSNLDTMLTSLQQIYMRSGSPWAYAGIGFYFRNSPSVWVRLCDKDGIPLSDLDGSKLYVR